MADQFNQPMQNNGGAPSQHTALYWFIAIVVIIVILVGAWWVLSNNAVAPTPSPTVSNTADTSEAILNDLEGLNVDELDAEFEAIDAEMENL